MVMSWRLSSQQSRVSVMSLDTASIELPSLQCNASVTTLSFRTGFGMPSRRILGV